MVNVSEEIKHAFNPNNGSGGRYIDYNVKFEVINNEAQSEADILVTEDEAISKKYDVFTNYEIVYNFATFEKNGFSLDGTMIIPPMPDENLGGIGFMSNTISDEFGNTDEYIEFVNVTIQNVIAITINFGYVIAVDFNVTYYDEYNNVIHSKMVIDNENMIWVYQQAVNDIYRIAIHITKIDRAYTRVRISSFMFGVSKNYNKANSEEMSIIEVVDPFNERVPSNEMKLTTSNFAKEFNIFEPTGIYEYFSERQLLIPKIGATQADGTLGYINMGKYYLQKPKLTGNTLKIALTATDILGIMQDTQYTKGIYKTATIKTFLNDVLIDFGIDEVICPASFDNISVTTYIKTTSHSDALRLIAQATNTLLYVNKAGIITFEQLEYPPLEIEALTQNDYNLDNGFSPSDDTIINTIEIEAVTLTVATTVEKLAEFSSAGTVNIKYEASTNQYIEITGGAVTNAEYFVDNAKVTITGGTAIVYGKKIIINKSTISVNNKRPNDKLYIYTVKDNLFVQSQNATSVASYMLNLKAAKRRMVKIEYRGYPYFDVGDTLTYEINNNTTQPFFVVKNSLKLSGGMTGSLESREL